MRILFFIEGLGSGGKERRLVELIKELDKCPGFELSVVLMKNVIHYDEIRDTKSEIHIIERKKLKKDPTIFYKFFRIAYKFKPDLIHVWGNLVGIYAVPTKLLLQIPMINSQIADAPSNFSKSKLNHKLIFPFSDLILANSYAGIDAYNAPKEKSLVIYNGFNFDRIENLTEEKEVFSHYDIPFGKVVTMVGSFSDKKDYETYIKMAINLLKLRKDVTFLCIGSGDSKTIEDQVPIEIKHKILFLGKIKDVESIMNISDIGVLCTYTEGIPNSILEFMALKKPVIICGGGGSIELIDNNVNGYLLQAGDFDGLGQKISFLLGNIEISLKMGIKSYEIVKNKFNIGKMAINYIDHYKSIKKNIN